MPTFPLIEKKLWEKAFVLDKIKLTVYYSNLCGIRLREVLFLHDRKETWCGFPVYGV